MSVWQRLNAPRNGRERRVAKIARDLERERIIALLQTRIEHDWKENYCEACDQTDYLVALIKGESNV